MLDCKEDEPTCNAKNYKGIYFDEDSVQQYYEAGAHFSHRYLCQKLEEIIFTLSPERRGNSIYDTPNISNCKLTCNV